MRNWLLLALFLSSGLSLVAQKQPLQLLPHDTSIHSIKDFLKAGKIEGHFRNSFMATFNQGSLKDYWTNASGGSIKYHSPLWHGIEFGLKGSFTYQTLSSDLLDKDPLVQKGAKWESELYDVLRPGEYKDLSLLEELYLKLNMSNSYLTFGKIDINTGPLLLRRDGRMKPFLYRGFWSEINEWEKHKLVLGWINGVSPRGINQWFNLAEAIGINNNGFLPNGEKAEYRNQHQSKGIAALGYQYHQQNGFQLQVWQYWFHQLHHLTWVEGVYQQDTWSFGLQLAHQRAAKFQAELDFENRYMQPEERPLVMSTQATWKPSGQSLQLSWIYLHVFGEGRFLFPRELGREGFYASQARSWIDGFGKSSVYMTRIKWNPKSEALQGLSLDSRISYTQTSGLGNWALNKYNIPNFFQVTLLLDYHFKNTLEGMHLRALYIGKWSAHPEETDPNILFYRTNLDHFNLIFNLDF